MRWKSTGESVPRAAGPEEHLQGGYVRLVAAQAHGIDGKSKNFRLFETEPRIIELGQTVAFSGNQPVSRGSIHGPRWMNRGTASPNTVKKIVPIPADPHGTLPILPHDNPLDAELLRRVALRAGTILSSSGAVDCNSRCQVKSHRRNFCIDTVSDKCDTFWMQGRAMVSG